MNNTDKVIVAMSGGVDSSVAAALLKEQGYAVVGITMQVWPEKVTTGQGQEARVFGGCCSLQAIDDARRVAKCLEIPHYVLNFRDEFKAKVIDTFIDEYRQGRTPNPCIRCNQFIKFEHLLKKAEELGASYVATGHYARVSFDAQNQYHLLKGVDPQKDQAYVLYTLSQKQLAHILFPLGGLTKGQVREMARKLALPIAEKEESQEICFIEDNNYVRFIKENCPQAISPGPIVDQEGKVVGRHEGIAFYTLGQRKGIGAHDGIPKYVIKLDVDKNTVVIGDRIATYGKNLLARQVNYVGGKTLLKPLEVQAKIRYNSSSASAILEPLTDGGTTSARLTFKHPQRSITPGQSVVFYQGEEVLGGGIID